MIRGERGGNALTPRFWPEVPPTAGFWPRRMGFKAPENLRPTQRDHPRPENRRRRASGGDVGPKVVRFSTQVRRDSSEDGLDWSSQKHRTIN